MTLGTKKFTDFIRQAPAVLPTGNSNIPDCQADITRRNTLAGLLQALLSATPRTISASSTAAERTVSATDFKILLDASAGEFEVTYPADLLNAVIFLKVGTDQTPVTITDTASVPNSIVLVQGGQALAVVFGDGTRMRAGFVS